VGGAASRVDPAQGRGLGDELDGDRVSGEPRVDAVGRRPLPDELLYHLVRNAGYVLPHETLLAKVRGREYVDEVDYLRVYIRRLREKLGDDPEHPIFIRTERGLGYRFLVG